MDTVNVQLHNLAIKDEVGMRCQKLFREFLDEYGIFLIYQILINDQIILILFLRFIK